MSDRRLRFLSDGGALGALMRDHDWRATPLGTPEEWPEALKTVVSIMLGSRQPMFVAWGTDRLMLYNDGYAVLCGARHPAALGRPFRELWFDIMDDVGPILERAFAGEATHMDDIALLMTRHGYPEEAHFSFSYTPVRDEEG
ncbi:MAG: PAS domain-containing protein, partial [Roseomonas sp.]|nr:PAS domain-containing protein [Roseomonas sp.]